MSNAKKIGKAVLYLIALAAFIAAIYQFGLYLAIPIVAIAGVSIPLVALLALSPLFRDQLLHNPDPNETGLKMFIEVKEGTAVCIMRGGEPVYIISNNKSGTYVTVFPFGEKGQTKGLVREYVRDTEKLNFLETFWRKYQSYIYRTTGVFPYIPFFEEPYVYPLPRLEQVTAKKDSDREIVDYTQIDSGPRYYTNHVRHQLFTWYFVYRSVDIQKIPFTVSGSAQCWIDENMVREALFQVDSWNILLDMSLREVVRSVLRSRVSLDVALGVVGENLLAEKEPSHALVEKESVDDKSTTTDDDLLRLGGEIQSSIKQYAIEDGGGKKSLEDFGIRIGRIGLNDLTDELSREDRAKFFTAAIAREEGRAAALRGMGEAEAAKALYEALKSIGEGPMAEQIIKGSYFAEGMKGSNPINALAASLTQISR